MATNDNYEYMQGVLIDSELSCSICSEPLKDPYCLPCEHSCCHECIKKWIEENPQKGCPVCRQPASISSLKQASRSIRNMLDRIPVKCKLCGRTEIPRSSIDNHINSECLKIRLYTSSTDDTTAHTGRRNQSDDRLAKPALGAYQSEISVLITENRQLRDQVHRQKDQVKKLRTEMEQIRSRMDQLSSELNKLPKSIQANEEEIEEQKTEHNKLQVVISTLKEHVEQQNTQIEELQAEDQSQKFETSRVEEHCHEHKIQIEQLCERLEQLTPHQNLKLEDYIIDKCAFGSELLLKEQNLTDRDMEIVAKHAIMFKQCTRLRLLENEISVQGASILADALCNNTSLEGLYLSYNYLSDRGVLYLAQALSVRNSTLRKLSLGSNGITDKGAKYLADMLTKNETVNELHLYENEIGDRGVQFLANALVHDNKTLNILSLHSNSSITDSSVIPLVEMIKCSRSLEQLDIHLCCLSKTGKARLREAAKSKDITAHV